VKANYIVLLIFPTPSFNAQILLACANELLPTVISLSCYLLITIKYFIDLPFRESREEFAGSASLHSMAFLDRSIYIPDFMTAAKMDKENQRIHGLGNDRAVL